MAEYIRFVDAVNGEPEYDSKAYAQAEEVKAEGVAYGYLNQLEVIEDTALQVIVKDGGMVSRGRIYIQDESSDGTDPKTLAIEAATSGYLRKDIVAIEFDINNKAAVAKIVKGTEVTSNPDVPTLIDTDNKWQVSIAVVNVSGSAITSIEDQRVIGNGRTNPAFLEDLSAPNIKINDGGKIYLNDAETAYLSYESNALNFKTPDRSEVNISGGLVAEVVLDADATSIVIDDLDINADGGMYEFWISGKATAGTSVSMFVNDDTTNTNYYRQYIISYSTSLSSGRYNDATIGALSSNQGQIHGYVWRNPLTNKCICMTNSAYESNGSIQHRIYTFDSVNTFANITKLNFEIISSSFAAGSILKMYKRN